MRKYVKANLSDIEEDLVTDYSFHMDDYDTINYIVVDKAGYYVALFDDSDYEDALYEALKYAKEHDCKSVEEIKIEKKYVRSYNRDDIDEIVDWRNSPEYSEDYDDQS